ncbi:MAG: glycosyltransferase family 87 protein [Planctomycetota bacterium]
MSAASPDGAPAAAPAPADSWDGIVKIALLVILAIVVVSTTVTYTKKALDRKSAILRWQPHVLALIERDVDIYETANYPNPPLMPIALYPIMKLPPLGTALVWFALKAAMATMSVIWALRLAAGRDGPWKWIWIAAVVLMSLRMFMSDLQHGNINLLILFLVIGGLWAWANGRDALAGLAIALGTTFKVTPALFIVYFADKGQWRTVIWSGVGLVLFFLVIPSIVVGPVRNWNLANGWADAIVWPYVKKGVTDYTGQTNQSLPGLWFRLTTDSVGVEFHDDATDRINLLALDPQISKWGLKAIMLGVVALLAWTCRTPMTDRRDWRLAAEFALVLIAMLWLSERSWKHHYVTMVLPVACVVAAVGLHPLPVTLRKWLAAALILAFVGILATTRAVSGWLHESGEGHKYLLAWGMFFWAGAILFASLVVTLRRCRVLEPSGANRTALPSV